ncbi:LOW QUALITY PROTEIN: hypothetical protein KIPB_000909 [Kipferlia bialata]|uniref:Tyrosine-protein kinase ephrin type A/B receptor-like domain-containing protein n=1 Tax=Kipferlia bialata TaxID=797122 RepID=A0A9K3GEV9_9EUKA|nr:LOW QUALITY PROTEIN: hypothetical protein KIPB_000909 [Kipferlia bialata]
MEVPMRRVCISGGIDEESVCISVGQQCLADCQLEETACARDCLISLPEVDWWPIPNFGAPPARRMNSLLLKDTSSTDRERLLLFGGTDTLSYYSDVWYYNTHSNGESDSTNYTWYKAAVKGDSPPPRSEAIGFLSGTNLYIGFGRKDNTFYSDVWVLNTDPEDMVWREVDTPLGARSGAFSAPLDVTTCHETGCSTDCNTSCATTCGADDPDCSTSCQAECLLTCPMVECDADTPTGPTVETCLLVFGGAVGNRLLRETWLFTPSTETFTSVPHLDLASTPPASAKGCAVSAGDTVYLHGGMAEYDYETGLRQGSPATYAFSADTMAWSIVHQPDSATATMIQNMPCYLDSTQSILYSVYGMDVTTGDIETRLRSLPLCACTASPASDECEWSVEYTSRDLARHSHTAAQSFSKVAFMIGGWRNEVRNDVCSVYPDDNGYSANTYVLNPVYDGGPPTGLESTAYATSGDSVYAYGGRLGDGSVLNTLIAFNTTATCIDMCHEEWQESGMEACHDECDIDKYLCDSCESAHDTCLASAVTEAETSDCDTAYTECTSGLDAVEEPCYQAYKTCGVEVDEYKEQCTASQEECVAQAPPAQCADTYYACYDLAETDADVSVCYQDYLGCFYTTAEVICDTALAECEAAEDGTDCEAAFNQCYQQTDTGACYSAYWDCANGATDCVAGYWECVAVPPDCTALYTSCNIPCTEDDGPCEATCAASGAPTPNYWVRPEMGGSVPDARYDAMMVSFGPLLMVYGGRDSDGAYLDDEFTYHTDIKEINEQISTGKKPSARSASAVTAVGETLYLFGGMDGEGVLGDMYSFSYFDKEWTALTRDRASLKPALSHASLLFTPTETEDTREGTYTLSDGTLYLQGGVSTAMMCVSTLYRVDIDTSLGTVSYSEVTQLNIDGDGPSTINTAFSNAPLSVLGKRALATGGRSNRMTSEDGVIRVFDFSDESPDSVRVYEITASTGETMERNRMATIQSVVQNYFTTIGGSLVESNTAPEGQAVAEVGTVYQASTATCESCPKGHFSAHDGMAECTPCPAGFYNGVPQGNSRLFCLACPSGTYNSTPGQSECLPCPDGKSCPVACVDPVDSTVDGTDVVVNTPQELEVPTERAKQLQLILYIVLGLVSGSVLLIVVAGKRSIIKALDLYSVPYVFTMPAALGSKNTWIGGIFSGLFICAFVVMGGGLIIPFLKTNLAEDRSLVPLCLADTTLTATLDIDISLTGGFETCTLGGVAEGECAPEVTVTLPSGVTASQVEQKCSQPVGDTTTCRVQLSVSEAELQSRLSEYGVTLLGSGEYFASIVDWNVTSAASNPGQYSSIAGQLLPDAQMTFRGTAEPTEIGVFSTESLYHVEYEAESSGVDSDGLYNPDLKNPSTGRIFEFIGYERGSMVNSQNFWDQNGVSLTIAFERSENILSWKQYKVQDLAAFLAALLGSLTGLQGTFGGVAGAIRSVWCMIKDKYGKDVFTKKVDKMHDKKRGKRAATELRQTREVAFI